MTLVRPDVNATFESLDVTYVLLERPVVSLWRLLEVYLLPAGSEISSTALTS